MELQVDNKDTKFFDLLVFMCDKLCKHCLMKMELSFCLNTNQLDAVKTASSVWSHFSIGRVEYIKLEGLLNVVNGNCPCIQRQ